MTAEVAILNKSAVALAADSAVTIQHGKGFKIYNTNKLFHLCHSNPVGIMVYANAELMSVPWETIIKQYRKQLGSAPPFNTLEEYGANFISYLSNNPILFPASVQDETALQTVYYYLSILSRNIDKKIKAITDKKTKISDAQIKQVTYDSITEWHDGLKALPELPDTAKPLEREVLRKYRRQFNKFITDVFQPLPLAERPKQKLRKISTWLLTKNYSKTNLIQNYSGIVIAGFGEADMYPAAITYRVESVVLNRLRYLHLADKSDRITAKEGEDGTVIPFAQEEVVASFMAGIDPNFYTLILRELAKVFDIYPDEILKKFPRLAKKRKAALLAELKSVGPDLVNIFDQVMSDYRQAKHINPIARAVSVLPKEELAFMAEALVSLTSTKRRVTLDAETVGGPIDVAVISKGDGFIWIRRKHYFNADQNPQFFGKYYR